MQYISACWSLKAPNLQYLPTLWPLQAPMCNTLQHFGASRAPNCNTFQHFGPPESPNCNTLQHFRLPEGPHYTTLQHLESRNAKLAIPYNTLGPTLQYLTARGALPEAFPGTHCSARRLATASNFVAPGRARGLEPGLTRAQGGNHAQ